MCRIVMQAVEQGNAQVIEDVKRIARYGESAGGEGVLPKTPQELCNQVFTTLYMGMKKQSSRETRQRARGLAAAIGSYHVNLDIDDVYEAQKKLVVSTVGFEPRFKVEGGSVQENLTLQCLQARIRMVTAYVRLLFFSFGLARPPRWQGDFQWAALLTSGRRSLDRFSRQLGTDPGAEACWCLAVLTWAR